MFRKITNIRRWNCHKIIFYNKKQKMQILKLFMKKSRLCKTQLYWTQIYSKIAVGLNTASKQGASTPAQVPVYSDEYLSNGCHVWKFHVQKANFINFFYKILSKWVQPTLNLAQDYWYLKSTDVISSTLKVIIKWNKDSIEYLTMTVAQLWPE